MRVLGIDPGLTRCGLGVVEGSVGRPLRWSASASSAPPPTCRWRCGCARSSAGVEAWLDEHRPDAVAVERVFSQHNVRTVMGTAQASGIAMVVAARRGLPVALHTPSEVKAAVSGSGRADKAQVGAMVTRLLRLDAAAQAGRRRRRARAGHLPHLARRRPGPHRRGAGRPPQEGAPDDRLRHGHRRRRRRSPRAVLEVGGVGLELHLHARTPWPRCASAPPATLPTSMVVREDSLTLFGFLDDDEKAVFELLQTASGVGPKLAQAMLAVHTPDELRRAVAAEDVKTLTTVPGIGQKGAQRIILELKDRIGVPGRHRSPARRAPGRSPPQDAWRGQVHAGLVGLGWSAKEADQRRRGGRARRRATRPRPTSPALLRAALRTLSKA